MAFGAEPLLAQPFRLKTDAPFWKSEETPAGERWVEARGEDELARKGWIASPPD